MRMLEVLTILVVSSVVFVNGWTDAPNAIAGAVATKAMSYRAAVQLAAACNLLGIIAMSLVNSSVAGTITGMADFASGSPTQSLAALFAAMLSIVIFAVAAWYFGIPTSESHALMAALTGAALSLSGGLESINPTAWKKILLGLAMSLALGFLLGFCFARTLGKALEKLSGGALDRFQIISAGGMAFMHGAQDGQKFVAVFVIAELLAKGRYYSGAINLREHPLVLILCALVMALGTSVGGKRIIDTVGTRMVRLKKHQSVCADMAGGLCLLFASLTGIPMSTTHTKTTAIMGATADDIISAKKNPAGLKIIGGMFLAWAVTFPVCGGLGFVLAKIILRFHNF